MTGTGSYFVTDPEQYGSSIGFIRYEGSQGEVGTLVGVSGGAASTSTGKVGLMAVHGVVKFCHFSTTCTVHFALPLTAAKHHRGVASASQAVKPGHETGRAE